jgi:acyl-CoA synthetase (AMP-forming)/AMP-acid ligase II
MNDLYQLPAQNLRRLIDHFAEKNSEASFASFTESKQSLNYLQLQSELQLYAKYFSAMGIEPGETISFMLGNGPASLKLFLASLYYGCVCSPLNPAAGQEQINYVIEHSDTRWVFSSEQYLEQVLIAEQQLDRTINIIITDCDAGPIWPTPPSTTLILDTLNAAAPGLLMYTSGTTGQPKGVILTQLNLLSGGMNTAIAHQLTPDDKALCVLPLCHINAQCVTVMAPLVSGGSLIMPHSFSRSAFWPIILDYNVTWFSVVPTIISYLMHSDQQHDTDKLKASLSGVRFGRSASAALPPSLHAGFEERFGIPIIETMGLTETSAQILSNPMTPLKGKYGSPGIPFGTEVKIIDTHGRSLPDNTEGELLVRGTCVMSHYYKNPTATAAAKDSQGWLHTGDLARIDNDGFVFITGRLKELIIKGGENIAPREIDDVLYSHPNVIEAGALGINDQHYGQEVIACVVVNDKLSLSESDLQDFCRSRLGAIKTPSSIFFLDDLPKGPSGKIQRLKLLEQLQRTGKVAS